LLSQKEYEWLCACARKSAVPRRDTRGLITLKNESALDDAAMQITEEFDASVVKTAREL
jgi:hypothetical protein